MLYPAEASLKQASPGGLFASRRPRAWARVGVIRPVQAPAARTSDSRATAEVEDFFSPPRTYDLWTQNSQMTGRVLRELDAMQRQMDHDFEGAFARAEQLAQRAQQRAQQEAGVLERRGDDWQTYTREQSYEERTEGGFVRGYITERVTVLEPQPSLHAQVPLHSGLLPGSGLLLAAFLAGAWAAATAAFRRGYHLTTYGEGRRWLLLLLWPLLLLFSGAFRQQFWAAVRGQRVGSGGQDADGASGGDEGAAVAAH